MEKGNNEVDSDVLPLSETVSFCLPFESSIQPVLQPDKQDAHPSLSLRHRGLTPRLSPKQGPSHTTKQAVTTFTQLHSL